MIKDGAFDVKIDEHPRERISDRIEVCRAHGSWWGYVDGVRKYGSQSKRQTINVCQNILDDPDDE